MFFTRLLKSIVIASIGTVLANPVLGEELTVSPFKGSDLYQTYNSRFELLPVLTKPVDSKGNPTAIEVEGATKSQVYKRPEDVSSLELFRSYEQTLKQNGFDILLACREKTCKSKRNVAITYRDKNPIFKTRKYKILKRQRSVPTYLTSFTNHYLSAKKESGGKTHYVVVIISDQFNLYSVDVLSTAKRETGTVTVTSKMISDGIINNGKVVLSGIFFDTGRSTITKASSPALDAIANYLKSNAKDFFYVVGHTDDTGDLNGNLKLSTDRAASVINALERLGIKRARLSPHGVGPFSPAATNVSPDGQEQNRRVELVLRLP